MMGAPGAGKLVWLGSGHCRETWSARGSMGSEVFRVARDKPGNLRIITGNPVSSLSELLRRLASISGLWGGFGWQAELQLLFGFQECDIQGKLHDGLLPATQYAVDDQFEI